MVTLLEILREIGNTLKKERRKLRTKNTRKVKQRQ